MRYFEPGEIIRRIRNNKPLTDTPSAMDAILYIEYMLLMMKQQKAVVRLTINEGQFFVGCLQADNLRQLYVEDATGETLFMAYRHGNIPWEIVVFKDGRWKIMLQFAYEKVRTCMDSIDRFISEFPPIGVAYQSDELEGEEDDSREDNFDQKDHLGIAVP